MINTTKARMDIKNVKLIIYDFDGVMTDNRVLLFADGREAVFINRSDGLAVKAIKDKGIRQLIISTEENHVVGARAKKLGIPCLQAVKDKKDALKEYLLRNKIDRKKAAFVGNDINDLQAMNYVGVSVAPADAHPKIRKSAKIVLSAKGGGGVIRELLDFLRGFDND